MGLDSILNSYFFYPTNTKNQKHFYNFNVYLIGFLMIFMNHILKDRPNLTNIKTRIRKIIQKVKVPDMCTDEMF